MPIHPDSQVRRALRVLGMVAELHKRGYQLLRVMPYIGGPGAWRCSIGPSIFFLQKNGAQLHAPPGIKGERSDTAICASYSGADDGQYFDWPDAKQDDRQALADKFVLRFPRLAHYGLGWDHLYAGWYLRMLGLAEAGLFPVAFGDYYEPAPGMLCLQDLRPSDWKGEPNRLQELPAPPPGHFPGTPDL
jgi:hypothetical protein